MRIRRVKFRNLVQTLLCVTAVVIVSHCGVWAAADKMLEDADFLLLLGSDEFSLKYQGRGGSEALKSTDNVIRRAESGDGFACFMLATSYYNGVSVDKNDAEALRWMQKAAEYDVDWACCTYIVLAVIAEGGEEYLDDALRYCRKYSEKGYREANNNLGVCYAKGIGVGQDPERAANLFRDVANVGMFEGLFNFGLCNLKGFGVKQSYEQAKELFSEASLCANDMGQVEMIRSILSYIDSRRGGTAVRDDMTVNVLQTKKSQEKQDDKHGKGGKKPGNDNVNYEFYRAAGNGNTRILANLLAEYDIDPDAKSGSSEGTAALHVAEADAVAFLIENGADIEARTNTGQTPLAWAALYNSDTGNATIKELARLGAKIDPRDRDGYTPLYRAIWLGNLKAAELLLELGADVNVKVSDGKTPMHSAARRGDVAAMELLKKHGADLEAAADDGQTPLTVTKDAGAMEWLLANTKKADGNSSLSIGEWVKAKGLEFDDKDDKGRILEHYAAEEGRTDILEWLRKKNNGNSRRWSDNEHYSPFHRAVMAGQVEAMEWQKKHGADINERAYKGQGAMHLAAVNGDIPALEWLKRNGYFQDQVYQIDHDRITPMHLAAAKGYVETMRWLKGFGADVNSETLPGLDKGARLTPLHMAMANGQVEAMQWLKDQGVDITKRNSDGFSPMHFAAMFGQVEAMEWLRGQGVNLGTENSKALTPMLLAAANGQLEAMRYLQKHGVDVNKRNSEGFAPIHLAAQNGRIDVMQWLKDNEADLNVMNYLNQTPLHFAEAAKQKQAVEWLKKQGAVDKKIGPRLAIHINGKEMAALAIRKCDAINKAEAEEKALRDSLSDILDSLYSNALIVGLNDKPKILSEEILELTVKCEIDKNYYEAFIKEFDQILATYRELGAVREMNVGDRYLDFIDLSAAKDNDVGIDWYHSASMTFLDNGEVETTFVLDWERADEYDPIVKSYDWFLDVRGYDFSAGKTIIRHRYKIPQKLGMAIEDHPIFDHPSFTCAFKIVVAFKDAKGEIIHSADIDISLDKVLFGHKLNQNTLTITPAVMTRKAMRSEFELQSKKFTFTAVDMKRIKTISLSAKAVR